MLAKPLKLIAVQWTASKLPNSNHKPSPHPPPPGPIPPVNRFLCNVPPFKFSLSASCLLSNKMHIFSERHAVYQWFKCLGEEEILTEILKTYISVVGIQKSNPWWLLAPSQPLIPPVLQAFHSGPKCFILIFTAPHPCSPSHTQTACPRGS